MTPTHTKSFRRYFFELISGSIIAQILNLVLMPVISRLYAPAEMGDYALFVAISSIVGALAGLRLDSAVVLAADAAEGSRLVWLGLSSATIVGLASIPFLYLTHQPSPFVLMTALTITCVGGIQILMNWHSWRTDYKLLARRSATEKLIVLCVGLSLGWVGYTRWGLIGAQMTGCLYSVLYMTIKGGLHKPVFTKEVWKGTFHKFSDFPRRNFLSYMLLSLSVFLPSVLFAILYSKSDLGQFNLVTRVFEIPMNLVGVNFQTVYYKKATLKTPAERKQFFRKSLFALSMVFLPGFAIVAWVAPNLFRLVFGANWVFAGELARWLAPAAALRLLFISQSALLLVKRKLNVDLLISAGLFTAQIGGLLVGYFLFNTISASVAVMSLASTLTYIAALAVIHKVAEG